MNKRQFKKVGTILAAKVVAKMLHPELDIKTNKVEKRLFRNHWRTIRPVVLEAYREMRK